MCLGSDGADGVCVPDDKVGIRAHGNPTLTRVQVQDLGCIGAGDCHEHVLIHLSCSLGGKQEKTRDSKLSFFFFLKKVTGTPFTLHGKYDIYGNTVHNSNWIILIFIVLSCGVHCKSH